MTSVTPRVPTCRVRREVGSIRWRKNGCFKNIQWRWGVESVLLKKIGFSQISKDRRRFCHYYSKLTRQRQIKTCSQSLLMIYKQNVISFMCLWIFPLSRMLLYLVLDTVSSSGFVKQKKSKFSSASCQFDTHKYQFQQGLITVRWYDAESDWSFLKPANRSYQGFLSLKLCLIAVKGT